MALSKILPASQEVQAIGKNLIINGAMQVAQRGTSLASYSSGNGVKVLDRWKTSPGSAGTWTLSQDSDSPDEFSNSLKFLCTTANASLSSSSSLSISQLFEGLNLTSLAKGTASAKSLTLSMWVKSNKIGTYIAELFDADNSRSISYAYTISLADTWEYKTIVFVGDTTGTLTFDNTQAMRLSLWLVAGTDFSSGTLATSWGSPVSANRVVGQVNLADTVNNYFAITGVQLELGSAATPFEHRSYGDELLRCQRYCYRPFVTSGLDEDAELGWPRFYASRYSNGGQVYITYPVSMRTDPVLTYSAQSGTIDTDQSSYVLATLRDSDDTAFYLFNFQADAEL